MQIQPYVFFNGRCEEALALYRRVMGAETVTLMRFKENPDPPGPGCIAPGLDDKIMHAEFRVGSSTVMASDGMADGKPVGTGVSLSLTVDTAESAQRIFDALATDGGSVQMPMGATFFSPAFGMVADRFGLSWMVYVAPAAQE